MGIHVVERVPLEIPPTEANRGYLRTKREKLGHLLSDAVEEEDRGKDGSQ